MTLPKKKSRPLEVDGVNYRWMVGKTDHRDGTANVVIELPDGSNIDYRAKVEKWDPNAGDYGDGEYQGIPVTPAMVRDFIRSRLGA